MFDELQSAGGTVEHRDRRRRALEVPAAVRLASDGARRAQRVSHRLQAGAVIVEGPLPHPYRGCAATGLRGQAVGLSGIQRRDRDRDRHAAPHRVGPADRSDLDGRRESARRLPVVTTRRRAELTPALRPFDQHPLADVHTADRVDQRDREHGCRVEVDPGFHRVVLAEVVSVGIVVIAVYSPAVTKLSSPG